MASCGAPRWRYAARGGSKYRAALVGLRRIWHTARPLLRGETPSECHGSCRKAKVTVMKFLGRVF